jgi:hypothetical protein
MLSDNDITQADKMKRISTREYIATLTVRKLLNTTPKQEDNG